MDKKFLHTVAVTLSSLAVLTQPLNAEAQTGRFYERKAEGWFWYAREPEPEPEVIEPEPEALQQTATPQETPVAVAHSEPQKGPAVFSSAWLKENMPKYLMAAIDDPTVENVKAYLYLQRVAMDRAEQYANASQMATMGDPFLDETMRRPLAGFAVNTVDSAAGLAKNKLVTEIAQKAGLFVFFTSKCSLCEIQAPLLKSLAEHEGFSLIPISLDGKNLQQNPFDHFKADEGHADMLDVKTLPALFLASPGGEFAPVGQGAFALPDLQQRIIVAAKREGWISEDEFNRTRPIVNYDNLAQILVSSKMSEQPALAINADPEGFVPQSILMKHIRSAIGGRQ